MSTFRTYHRTQEVSQVTAAPSGWRLVRLLSRAPWVQEHSVACWALTEDRESGWKNVEPMIIIKEGYRLELADDEWQVRLSGPDDPPDRWVEEAREIVRERRRMARRWKKQREKAESSEKEPAAPKPKPRKKLKRSARLAPLRRKLESYCPSLTLAMHMNAANPQQESALTRQTPKWAM